MRRYPPFKSCGFVPGSLYRVVGAFTSDIHTFEQDDVLLFEGEGYIPEEECDVWRFTDPQTRRAKAIVGRGLFIDPAVWRQSFENVTAPKQAAAI